MALSDKIRRLRQENRWTQAKLGEKLNVHQKQISAYGRGAHAPSTDLLIKVAACFNVTLDYLASDMEGKTMATIQLADRKLHEKMLEIDKLSEADRRTIKEVLDTYILEHKFQKLAIV